MEVEERLEEGEGQVRWGWEEEVALKTTTNNSALKSHHRKISHEHHHPPAPCSTFDLSISGSKLATPIFVSSGKLPLLTACSNLARSPLSRSTFNEDIHVQVHVTQWLLSLKGTSLF